MQAAILNDVSGQDQELRYLTAHFRDLQGVRMAPFWGALPVLTSLAKASSFSRGMYSDAIWLASFERTLV